MNFTWRTHILNVVLLLALLLPARIPTRAAPAATQTAFDCSAVTEIPQAECEALVALYESTDGANWTNNTDWLATNTPCSWFGVTCSEGNITQLSLGSNQLNGSIPPEIGNLTLLVYVRLYYNQLSGPIPSEIGNLTALTALYLSSNQLSGAIPTEISNLTALTWLDLSSNQLNGVIPPEISYLSNLTYLHLGSNQLSGSIPPEIGNLTAIEYLYLYNNQLSGPIPQEIGQLTMLRVLNLWQNQLSGAIPSIIGNLNALRGLLLGSNQLSGSIPPGIGNLTALANLSLSSNQLSGPIPPEIGNLVALEEINLGWNQLSGAIPPEIGNLTALANLNLSSNQLGGPIPPEIGNLVALEQINLGWNQLSGTIPPEIGNLTALTNLDLGYNQLSGPIPPETGNLTALGYLSLRFNQLSGPIPPEIGNLAALWRLDLVDNQLSGAIPPEIGNLTALTILYLSENQLSGPIPPEIGNLTALWTIWLSDNQMSGSIPPEIGSLAALTELSLSDNQLNGPIPISMTTLTALNFFAFYGTYLCVPATGAVPSWLNSIPTVLSTGQVCGQAPGSLSGTVISPYGTPLAGIQVDIYQDLYHNLTVVSGSSGLGVLGGGMPFHHLTTTLTSASGAYRVDGLGQDISYAVRFVDPSQTYAPEYYDDVLTVWPATSVTVTLGITRTSIDAILNLPQPPVATITTTDGSVTPNPVDGTVLVNIPVGSTATITVTRVVTCASGAPSDVALLRTSVGQPYTYTMALIGDDRYQAVIPAADLTADADLDVVATCSGIAFTTPVATINLYDPSGIISDASTSQPIAGAQVTLYHVPDWYPKTGPDDDRPNTCESNNSKDPTVPWSQPAPSELGIVVNPEMMQVVPGLAYQLTDAAGHYGWDVGVGCWYVEVSAEGYELLTSPVVGIPPEVTDLNLALTPVSTTCPATLKGVGIVGPLEITSTLYINTLYTFQAVITPTDATLPITYTWSPEPQTGQGTDTATYRWSTPDMYTITLTAENCGGSVSTTRTFVIEDKDAFTVFLPLVQRNFSPCGTIPTLLSPANESILDTLIPLFRWDNGTATEATTGRLQVARDSNFLQPVTTLSFGGYPGEYDFRFSQNFDPGVTYYWRAWLLCGDLQGPYSDVWSFTAGSGGVVLPAPTLVAPSNNSTQPVTGVTLQWTPVSGATGYLVHWSETDTGGYNYQWVDEASYFVDWLDDDTTYRWWVSAYNDYAIGADSETWRFTTTSVSAAETNSETFIGFRVENGDVIEIDGRTE